MGKTDQTIEQYALCEPYRFKFSKPKETMFSNLSFFALILVGIVNGAPEGVVKKAAKQAESTGRAESRVRVYQFTKVFIAVDERKTWEQARAVCNDMGGDLATIRTIAEQNYVMQFASTLTAGGEIWIGAQRDSSDVWRWVTGDKVSKDIKFKVDYGTLDKLPSSEKCFAIHNDNVKGFCSAGCKESLPFICAHWH